jgi:chlorobactene glucosyltransferase
VLTLMAWLLRGLLALVVLNWVGLALRTWQGRRKRRFHLYPDDDPLPAPAPGVSVVIPARNEVANIGPCLDAVLAQDHPALEVVVLDDGSTDGTSERLAAYAEDPRVQVVQGQGDPPVGWFGKPWAVHRAQQHATMPWLLFIDADVRLQPHAVSRSLAYAVRHELGMLSGFGTLVTGSFWERVLQPVVGGLIVAGNDADAVNDPERRDKAMANGQFILFERGHYERIGGHEAVRNDVLDDVGLARAAKAGGVPFHMTFMRPLFSCRMYSGLGEIWSGWRKNLFAGMHYRWSVVAAVELYLLITNLLPWLLLPLVAVGVLGVEWGIWSLSLIALMQGVRFYLDRVFSHPAIYGPTQILGVSLVMLLILDSAWSSTRGRVAWKGRKVDVAKAPDREAQGPA